MHYIIAKDEQEPLFELQTHAEIDEKKIVSLPIKQQEISDFVSTVAQLIPTAAIGNEFATNKFMEVIAHGELIHAADGDGYRALVKGVDGKFSEHARLFEADKLQSLISVGMAWQVASFIVAQKHLADINEKLATIQQSIDTVIEILERNRQSKLKGIHTVLKQLIQVVQTTPYEKVKDHVSMERIHTHEDELDIIYEDILLELQSVVSEKIKHKEMFGTAELVKDLEAKISKIDNLIKLTLFSLQLKATCYHLRCFSPNTAPIQEQLKFQFFEKIDEFYKNIENIEADLEQEINGVDSIVNSIQDQAAKLIPSKETGVLYAGVLASTCIPVVGRTLATGLMMNQVLKSKNEKANFSNSESVEKSLLEKRREHLKNVLQTILYDTDIQIIEMQKMLTLSHKKVVKKEPIKLIFEYQAPNTYYCHNTKETIKV